MVHSIFQNQDKKHLDAVFQAAVIFSPLPSTLFLQLGTNIILPPAWLESLSVILHHDDPTVTPVACHAEYDGFRSSPCGFRLTAKDPTVDLHALFSVDRRSLHLAVSQVEITTNEGSTKRLANQTSLKAFREQGPRDASDEDESPLDLRDLFPSR